MKALGRPLGVVLGLAVLAASPGVSADDEERGGPRLDRKPPGLKQVVCTHYDGESDDLLTGGLGQAGLAGAAPGFADPANPTAAELRRLAIYTNYRALIDMTPGGGYGVLYGPAVDLNNADGKIGGLECLGFFGRDNVTAMVQIPETFDPETPCIVTGPSSGSRGVYGAMGSTTGWALGQGCAMAYTDKGTGTGFHNLAENTVNLIRGERADADVAGKASHFTARITDRRRERFNAANPDRFAVKHAHSRRNPEALWGKEVLNAIAFAYFTLHEEYPDRAFTRANTDVIAAGVSNGGAAALRATEQDRFRLIDALVVSEPNAQPRFRAPFTIDFADNPPFAEHSRSLFDYISFAAVYEGCANAAADPEAPLNLTPPAVLANRCESLAEKGLLPGGTLEELADAARQKLLDFGFLEEQLILDPSYWFLYLEPAVVATYINAYSRARVTNVLCGYTFGATDGTGSPMPIAETVEAVLFGTSGGVPPSGGVEIINNDDPDGPTRDQVSDSASNGVADQNLDGALCGRSLLTGVDPVTGRKLKGAARVSHRRLVRGIGKVLTSGDLGGRPAIIVAGRNDALVPVNHAARAYYGFSKTVEGEDSNLSYIEVKNAHHLDALNGIGGFDTRFIPLHHYFVEALQAMLDHLRAGAALPPSQVVDTIPRGGTPGSAPPISVPGNLPPIADAPGSLAILFGGGALTIPE